MSFVQLYKEALRSYDSVSGKVLDTESAVRVILHNVVEYLSLGGTQSRYEAHSMYFTSASIAKLNSLGFRVHKCYDTYVVTW
jgi:hypothetical protein